jgi:hypothetical protein
VGVVIRLVTLSRGTWPPARRIGSSFSGLKSSTKSTSAAIGHDHKLVAAIVNSGFSIEDVGFSWTVSMSFFLIFHDL